MRLLQLLLYGAFGFVTSWSLRLGVNDIRFWVLLAIVIGIDLTSRFMGVKT